MLCFFLLSCCTTSAINNNDYSVKIKFEEGVYRLNLDNLKNKIKKIKVGDEFENVINILQPEFVWDHAVFHRSSDLVSFYFALKPHLVDYKNTISHGYEIYCTISFDRSAKCTISSNKAYLTISKDDQILEEYQFYIDE